MQTEAKMVREIARRYAARCWWAETDDLIQEGWVALLKAQQTWDPTRGVSLVGYAGRAVVLHLRDYLWRMSAPVTGPKGHNEKLMGLYRAPVEHLASHLQDDTAPDLDAETWWCELTDRMEEVIREADTTGVAIRVVWKNEDVAKVAAELGVKVEEVRAKARVARAKLRKDVRLRELAMVA